MTFGLFTSIATMGSLGHIYIYVPSSGERFSPGLRHPVLTGSSVAGYLYPIRRDRNPNTDLVLWARLSWRAGSLEKVTLRTSVRLSAILWIVDSLNTMSELRTICLFLGFHYLMHSQLIKHYVRTSDDLFVLKVPESVSDLEVIQLDAGHHLISRRSDS